MARTQRKAIVSCAVTGAIHVPSLTPHLPITPAEIAEQAIGAAQAGAAILHLHARDPSDGRPTPDPDVFAEFLGEIHSSCDAVVNITTGGGLGMSLDERPAAGRRFEPELCSPNIGSFEFECNDVGHLYNLAHFLDRGVLRPPLFVQCILGILGGVGPDVENLVHMKNTADRLFGDEYLFSVLGAGRHQTRLVTVGAIMGGNVRVGLEDSVYLERGRLAQSNAEQVEKIVRILRELSIEAATPDEAREMLGLKGRDNTALAGAAREPAPQRT